ncbi:hypothetical protein PYW08_016959 [Mythimna loreyi]|nr:hypothetical protein PYW08_016959 [Mythimna loreyi]
MSGNSKKLSMEAKLKTKVPQEGTGKTGESLPESNSGSPTVSGGGIISQTLERKTDDMNHPAMSGAFSLSGGKVLVQQALHPGLFHTRPRSASVGCSLTNTVREETYKQDSIPSTSHTVQPPPWQRVPTSRNKKRKLSASSPPVQTTATSNRFTGLTIDLTDNSETPVRPSKPPPIILYGVEDINKLTQLLKTTVEEEQFTYKIVNKKPIKN